jgi:hypothetical protein
MRQVPESSDPGRSQSGAVLFNQGRAPAKYADRMILYLKLYAAPKVDWK